MYQTIRVYSLTGNTGRFLTDATGGCPFNTYGAHGCIRFLLACFADTNSEQYEARKSLRDLPFWYTETRLGCGQWFIKTDDMEVEWWLG